MKKTLLLPTLAFVFGTIALSLVNWTPSNSQPVRENEQPHQQQQVAHKPVGCQVFVDGHATYIEPNHGKNVNGRWASCQHYDGHPVLMYGDKGNLAN
jgi:hypothetical protein